MLSQGTPEAVARYQQARRTAASAVTNAKQWVWEECWPSNLFTDSFPVGVGLVTYPVCDIHGQDFKVQ